MTGFVDVSQIGTMLDEALGAAAALARGLPSARAEIVAALLAYIAQTGVIPPPEWLLSVSLVSLPPGMTLAEYLQQHAVNNPPPGRTYARLGGAPQSGGPGEPGPGEPGPGGPSPYGGGNSGGGSGGGPMPLPGTLPGTDVGDDPHPYGGGGRPRPDPAPPL